METRKQISPLIAILAVLLTMIIIGLGARQVNASKDFVEKYILLVITTGVTGFLIPYIFRIIDEQKSRSQKQFEDDLSRQNTVIAAQVQFLERFSELLWKYHALIAKVSYYKKQLRDHEVTDDALYKAAINAYEEGFWDVVIVSIQAEISKARRLVSPEAHIALEFFYKNTISTLDQSLTTLIEQNASRKIWLEFHDKTLKEFLVHEIDSLLFLLAQDMKLISSASNRIDARQADNSDDVT